MVASADRSGGGCPAAKAAGGVGSYAPAGHPAQRLPTGLPFDDAFRLSLVWEAAQGPKADQPFAL